MRLAKMPPTANKRRASSKKAKPVQVVPHVEPDFARSTLLHALKNPNSIAFAVVRDTFPFDGTPEDIRVWSTSTVFTKVIEYGRAAHVYLPAVTCEIHADGTLRQLPADEAECVREDNMTTVKDRHGKPMTDAPKDGTAPKESDKGEKKNEKVQQKDADAQDAKERAKETMDARAAQKEKADRTSLKLKFTQLNDLLPTLSPNNQEFAKKELVKMAKALGITAFL